jgi:hypothetical protein
VLVVPDCLAAGMSTEQIVEEYPALTAEGVQALPLARCWPASWSRWATSEGVLRPSDQSPPTVAAALAEAVAPQVRTRAVPFGVAAWRRSPSRRPATSPCLRSPPPCDGL